MSSLRVLIISLSEIVRSRGEKCQRIKEQLYTSLYIITRYIATPRYTANSISEYTNIYLQVVFHIVV